MTITIEIQEDEIRERAIEIVASEIANNISKGYHEGYFYRKDIKEAVREIIKSDIDNLTNRAVEAASTTIANKGIKKLTEQLLDGKDG